MLLILLCFYRLSNWPQNNRAMEPTTPETLHAVLSAEARSWTVSTFLEADPMPYRSGCTTASEFRTTIADDSSVFSDAEPVSLTVRCPRDINALTALATCWVSAEHLEIHIRLDTKDGGAFDIDALCRTIALYGPKVQNMSLTVPHTVDLATFRALYNAWQLVVTTRPGVPPDEAERLADAERMRAMKHASALFDSRWLSPMQIELRKGDLASMQPFVQMIKSGLVSLRCFIEKRLVVEQMLAFLRRSPPAVKPDLVVRCSLEDARALHPILADLWPYCASLWVVMDGFGSNDWGLSSLMVCDGDCRHNVSVDNSPLISLTGIVFAKYAGVTNAAMPLLANVQRVDITSAPFLTSEGFAQLAHCTDVKARYTNICDQDLQFFANAVSLELVGCSVGPDGIAALRNVQAIRIESSKLKMGQPPNVFA